MGRTWWQAHPDHTWARSRHSPKPYHRKGFRTGFQPVVASEDNHQHQTRPMSQDFMADRVLVTGGLGYLGSILCEHLLDAGYAVTALDNLMYESGQQGLFHLCANPAFDFIKGDVRDETVMRAALKTADVVVHLAAIVGAAACDRDPVLASTVNVDSVRLLNRLRSP